MTEKPQIKLVAIDMDGTLLNSRHEISKENRKAIAEAEEKGVHVVISTGRAITGIEDYVKTLQLSSYIVTVNGSEIWDPAGELLERNPLKHEFVQILWDLRNKYETHYWAESSKTVFREDFPEDVTAHEWLKFGYHIDNHEVREELLKELKQNKELEISNSSPLNIEVNALGINKASALKKICDRLGLTMDQVMGIGDSLNDLAMITESGVGVAMGNAQEAVKEAADWVTATNNEEGVAKAIRHWVLER